jgi:LPXTG-motif cell wall-anchored protein
VKHTSDQDADAGQKLPQTASPLPLLGLLGMGSLVSGFIARKRKG